MYNLQNKVKMIDFMRQLKQKYGYVQPYTWYEKDMEKRYAYYQTMKLAEKLGRFEAADNIRAKYNF